MITRSIETEIRDFKSRKYQQHEILGEGRKAIKYLSLKCFIKLLLVIRSDVFSIELGQTISDPGQNSHRKQSNDRILSNDIKVSLDGVKTSDPDRKIGFAIGL